MIIIREIGIVLLFGILGCTGRDKNKPVSQTGNKPEIDKINLKDLNEQSINLEKYKGKTILSTLGYPCKPCLEEMPTIEKAQTILKDKNIVFLFASDETAQQIENFKANNDYKFNFLRVENPEELNIMSLPTTFIFNPDGKLEFSEIGYRKWDDKTNIDLILKITEQK